jgi:hypothetical protein
MLHWLAFSKQPLKLGEIAEVIAIDPDRVPGFDPDEVPESSQDVLFVCRSRVTVAKMEGYENDRVILAHLSVKEYLLSDRIRRSPFASFYLEPTLSNSFIMRSCVIYLIQSEVSCHGVGVKNAEHQYHLRNYAAEFWYRHAQSSDPDDSAIVEFSLRILSYSSPAYEYWLHLRRHDVRDYNHEYSPKAYSGSPLYLASKFGFRSVVHALCIQDPTRLDSIGGTRCTPLGIAAYEGHTHVIKTLLEFGANVDGAPVSPLLWAASQGKLEVVKFLAVAGTRIQIESCLDHAIAEGEVKVVEWLLKNHRSEAADVLLPRARESFGPLRGGGVFLGGGKSLYKTSNMSLLQFALRCGTDDLDRCVAIIRLLMEHGAGQSINIPDETSDYATALHLVPASSLQTACYPSLTSCYAVGQTLINKTRKDARSST